MSGEILSAYTTEDGDDIVALLFQTRDLAEQRTDLILQDK